MSPRRKRDRRVREISERLQKMVDEGHPLASFVLSWFDAMLDEWEAPGSSSLPPPFGDSPLLRLVESMLPSVDAEDPDSGAMIRALMERVRSSRDADERRHLSLSLEWFYLFFTRKTDLDFERWIAQRAH